MANHSPATTMKPKNQTRKASVLAAITSPLASLKIGSTRVPQLKQANGAGEEQDAGDAFGGDDQRINDLPQHGIGDRPVHQRIAGEGRVHAQHMLHEQIVGAVIGEVVEGDEQAEGSEREAHHDLGVARDQHERAPPA